MCHTPLIAVADLLLQLKEVCARQMISELKQVKTAAIKQNLLSLPHREEQQVQLEQALAAYRQLTGGLGPDYEGK